MPSISADNASFQHGPISCLSCFPKGSVSGCVLENDGWRVDNNPGYWGAANPEVLVLGFSKGANQRSSLAFEQIAFHNARSNLAEILGALGLIGAATDIDACFTAAEPKLGFASVVRCGLGKEVAPGKYATSGDVVRSAIASGSAVRRFFDGCTDRFLKYLPTSVRVVVFLGLDGPYLETLFQRVGQLHPSARRLNDLAYATETITFVHVIHPSPLATSHRRAWLRDDDSSLAGKRREVRVALGKASGEVVARSRLNTSAPKREASKLHEKTIASAFSPSAKIEDLIGMVRLAIEKGSLVATQIGNLRDDEDELKKLFRMRRADGEEFAIVRTGLGYRLWSSVSPAEGVPVAESVEYPPTRTRHSNLGCMPKLRGPKGRNLGARAWKLRFNTPQDALNFVV